MHTPDMSDEELDALFRQGAGQYPDEHNLSAWLEMERKLDAAAVRAQVRGKVLRIFALETAILLLALLGWLGYSRYSNVAPVRAEAEANPANSALTAETATPPAPHRATTRPGLRGAEQAGRHSGPNSALTTPADRPLANQPTRLAVASADLLRTPMRRRGWLVGPGAEPSARRRATSAEPEAPVDAPGAVARHRAAWSFGVAPLGPEISRVSAQRTRQPGTSPTTTVATTTKEAATATVLAGATTTTGEMPTMTKGVAALTEVPATTTEATATTTEATATKTAEVPTTTEVKATTTAEAATTVTEAAEAPQATNTEVASGSAAVLPAAPDLAANQAATPVPAPDSVVEKPRRQAPLAVPRLSLAVLYAPELSTVRWAHYTTPGSNVGAMLEYRLAPRWRLSAGALRSVKRYAARGSDYHPPAGYWTHRYTIDEIEATCRIIDLPLNLRYDVLQRPQTALFAAVGLSSLLMRNEDYRYYYELQNQPVVRKWSLRRGSNHWLSVLNLSAGYERRLGGRWAAQAEPFVKIPLGGVGFGKVKLSSAGAFFSLKYALPTAR
ncbi:hypothetical protein SAMN02745146_1312 [Hymenobacter daecheongensis DSM 21074]|uniref:Outer membrane protein beta-barrel domain-containing protein n=1 Tax=Hymenobacter daecheongensis DSM 21074 TaxID=1121955 RepID=A0A1M6CY38_9BACT|nr:hypothetical protein [Hymenobacter daecheongensis]SHI65906.1 hypothetical protein SAMN02745146_1312 [Hymenobacter daecheongensis DSM 21074]